MIHQSANLKSERQRLQSVQHYLEDSEADNGQLEMIDNWLSELDASSCPWAPGLANTTRAIKSCLCTTVLVYDTDNGSVRLAKIDVSYGLAYIPGDVNMVYWFLRAVESDPPPLVTPVEWIQFTDEPVDGSANAVERLPIIL